MGDTEYLEQHRHDFEPAIAHAITQLVSERAVSPVARLGQLLLLQAGTQQQLELPPKDSATGVEQWDLLAWTLGAGVHRVVAAALQQALADDTPDAALSYLKGVRGRSELQGLLFTSAVADGIVDLVWAEVQTLQRAGAASTADMASKFAGAIEMSYSGLDKFFGGLEGVVGPPDPHLFEAMASEHTKAHDAFQDFKTGRARLLLCFSWLRARGCANLPVPHDVLLRQLCCAARVVRSNYAVTTQSAIEWDFVVGEEATAPPELGRWPAEAEEKMPDRSGCRRKTPLAALEQKASPMNERLAAEGQPPLGREEIVAANLYTGPLFEKYNGVLRGLQSESPFLRNKMVQLCCPAAVAATYQGDAPLFKPANGSLSFNEAIASLNKYTTTLHGINSAVIKLGKLTKAVKVYRGIAGMALPPEFWEANNFGVRGGVENAFMSTTLDRSVAMGYAAGDASRMGIVLEVQQGMVNRGADMSQLSQYPHEQEILFGPLTGIEVLGTRIDGGVVVVECAFSINLTALTLEEVFGKRRKVVRDMCDQLAARARQAAEAEAWDVLRLGKKGESTPLPLAAFLQQRLMSLAGKQSEHYNEDGPLGEAIKEAVVVASMLPHWPEGLAAFIAPGEKSKKLAWVLGAPSSPPETGAKGGAEQTMPTAEELAAWSGPLVLARGFKASNASYPPRPNDGWLPGAIALLWMMEARGIDVSLDLHELSDKLLDAGALFKLSLTLSPNLTGLDLSQNNLTNTGGDYSGVRRFAAALSAGMAPRLQELNVGGCALKDESATLVRALKSLPLLHTLNFCSAQQGTQLSAEAVRAVGELLKETRTLTRLNLEYVSLAGKSGVRFAEGLEANCNTLTYLKLSHTELGKKGKNGERPWPMVVAALKGSAITELDVSHIAAKSDDAAILIDVLAETRIAQLSCAGLPIAAGDAEKVAAAVLAHPPLTDYCGIPIARLRGAGVETLDLKGVWLGQLGLIVLRQLLPCSHGTLRTLRLANNNLNSDDVAALSAVFPQLSSLTHLDLDHNRVDGGGLKALADVLPQTSISTLRIKAQSSGITNFLEGTAGAMGVAALAAVLPQTKLAELVVGPVDLDEEAGMALYAAARSCGASIKDDYYA